MEQEILSTDGKMIMKHMKTFYENMSHSQIFVYAKH